MDLVGGLLAFALTMVVISVAVTSVLETLQRALRLRQQGLIEIVRRLEDELRRMLAYRIDADGGQPTIDALVQPQRDAARTRAEPIENAVDELVALFSRAMRFAIYNPLMSESRLRDIEALCFDRPSTDPERLLDPALRLEEPALPLTQKIRAKLEGRGGLVGKLARRMLTFAGRTKYAREFYESIVADEFVKRAQGHVTWGLASDRLKALLLPPAAALQATPAPRPYDLAKDLGRHYDRLCQASRDKFARRSHMLGIVIGIVLAFALNVDALRLLDAYVSDTRTRELVLKNADAIVAQAKAANDPAAAPGSSAAAGGDRSRQDLLALLDAPVLPIGAAYFPYCAASADQAATGEPAARTGTPLPTDRRCAESALASRLASPFGLLWALGCLLTGFLAGLGSPFWFNLASQLMSLRSGARR